MRTVATLWITGPDGCYSVAKQGNDERPYWVADGNTSQVVAKLEKRDIAIGWAQCKAGITGVE